MWRREWRREGSLASSARKHMQWEAKSDIKLSLGHLYCTSGVTTSDEQPISTGLTTFYRGRLTLQTSLALPLAWTIGCKPSMVIGGSEARHTQVKGTWRYNAIWLSVPCPFLLFNLCLYIPPNINNTKRNMKVAISFTSLYLDKQNEQTN